MADVKKMEARLTALDAVVLDMRKEMVDLQRGNVAFQKEIWNLKSERFVLEDRMKTFEKEFQDRETQVENQLKLSEKTQGKMRDEITRLKDQVRELEEIATDIGHLKKLRNLFNHMAVKAHGLTDSGTRVGETENKVDDEVKRLKTRTDEHKQQIGIIENTLARTKPNMFHAIVRPSQELVDRTMVKLDVCDGVWHDDDGWFDRQSCCLVPQRDCRMVVAWRMCQVEEGGLRLALKSDAFTDSHFLGKTTYQHDVTQGLTLWGLKKGEKMWLVVSRGKGKAKVAWCDFMAWVVG